MAEMRNLGSYVACIFALASCDIDPNNTKTASEGFSATAPITQYLSGLESGEYPESLQEIMERVEADEIFIKQGEETVPPPSFYFINTDDQEIFLVYNSVDGSASKGASLYFRFIEGGTNFCNWTTDRKTWECFGV
ncbi:hypothetical protein KQ247_17460 [Ruegeria pomeroyi]|jgi:hypothetical protein|nr:hypothetical protein [Ruegeria pomeroyi]NVL02288.1 hypothetical protein [Ruegeria pomeroyi]QWV08579.1 hypothetical protein KQ247_17460 [Ruegeria pomeroyi]